MKYIKTLMTAIAICAAALMTASQASAMLTIKANHDHIDVDYNYHGSTVSVKGVSDPDVDIVVKIATEPTEQSLMRKDKVGGVIWMNVEKLHFKDVPNLYLMRSTKPVDEILSADKRREFRIGLDAIEQTSEVEPAKDEQTAHALFGQFIKYKESRKLYSEDGVKVDMSNAGDGRNYSTIFDWPYQATPGKYEVTVYSVKDGSVVESANAEVVVEQAGAVKFLSDMARNKAVMYGVLSIALALMAGFGVGMVFGKGGGAH